MKLACVACRIVIVFCRSTIAVEISVSSSAVRSTSRAPAASVAWDETISSRAAAFAEHRVVIPMTVLEELDHIKDRRDKSVSREARIAIQMIDKVVGSAAPQAIQAGVDIPGSTLSGDLGRLAIFPDQLLDANDNVPFLDSTRDQANDNRIINVALKYQSEHPDEFVCLVTKDINMRIKAKALFFWFLKLQQLIVEHLY